MEILYNNTNVSNQFLTPQETQNKPIVTLKGLDYNKIYTLIMYDPNAVGGNYIHWIVTNIYENNFELGNEILQYYGPHPPKGSGIHNYIFSLYETNNNTTKNIIPNKRQIELNKILNELDITGVPIYKTKFKVKNIEGGKRKRRVTRKQQNGKNKKTNSRRY